jgi:hypothetical protein
MKRISLLISLTMLSSFSFAETIRSSIHSVSMGEGDQAHLIKLNNGRVVFMSPNDKFLGPDDLIPGSTVEVKVDDDSKLESIATIEDKSLPSDEIDQGIDKSLPSRDATVLPNYSKAQKVLEGMNTSWRRNTECTDRAHIWSYEEWKKSGLIQNKVFMFFTNTYIRRYNYKWWFHVSPYTLVREHGNVIEYVMDRRYSSYPRHMKSWTDIFIRSKKTCPVKTYAHYRANKNGSEHCFLVKTSMYYRLPYHVRHMEDYGRTLTSFKSSEINFSYRAFKRRHVRKQRGQHE